MNTQENKKTTALFGPGGNSEEFYGQGFKSTKQAMSWTATYGLDLYEYQAGNGLTASDATLIEIGEAARQAGIKISLHAPYYISLSNPDGLIIEKSMRHIIHSAKGANLLGADIIVVHTGSVGKNSRTEALENVKRALALTLEKLNKHKIENVRIGLETMGKAGQLGTLDEVIELCKLDKILVPVVDFGHLYARSTGAFLTSPQDFYSVFDKIGSELSDETARYLNCHFSRIEYTKSGEKKHLTFSDPQFGPKYEPLMDIIAEHRLYPRIICESAGTMAHDALIMKKYYKNKQVNYE